MLADICQPNLGIVLYAVSANYYNFFLGVFYCSLLGDGSEEKGHKGTENNALFKYLHSESGTMTMKEGRRGAGTNIANTASAVFYCRLGRGFNAKEELLLCVQS